ELPLEPGEAADEILAIRRRMGPSVLQGSLFEATAEDEVAYRNEMVRSIRSAAAETAGSVHPASTASGGDILFSRSPVEERLSPEAANALRDAADDLEVAAQALERLEQYRRA